MPIWRFPPTRPPYQPQPRQRPTGRTLVSTTFPLTVTATQAQSLSVTQSRVYLRTVSLTQAQSVSVGLVPTIAQHYSLTVTAVQATTLSVTVLQGRLPNNYYATTFPLTENPISESNVWSLGGTDGLDWHNPRTTTGRVFGTQPGTDSPPYTDSIAVLKGTWGNDQEVSANLFGVAPPISAAQYYAEVELLLRFTISAHSTVGYEVTISVNALNNYVQINRWTGGAYGNAGSYVQIAGTNSTIAAGDVMRATIAGSVITVYQNGTQILTVTDSTVTTGKPGIGFFNWDTGAHVDPTTFGFSRMTAHTIGTPWPLGGTILQGQSPRLAQQNQLRRSLTAAQSVVLARGVLLNRVLAQPQTVLLSVASRVIPLLRSVAQAQSATLSLRKVILRVVNTSQGQSLQLLRLTRLPRTVGLSTFASLVVQSSGGGPVDLLGGTCAVGTTAGLTWVLILAPEPPRPSRPVTPPLTLSPADLAPALTLATADLPPALQPAYAPVVPPS